MTTDVLETEKIGAWIGRKTSQGHIVCNASTNDNSDKYNNKSQILLESSIMGQLTKFGKNM